MNCQSGGRIFLIGVLTNTLLMIGVTLLFGLYGSTNYTALATGASSAPPQGLTLLALTLVVVGVAFKLAAVPAHAWLPDVAEGSPPPAAAFLTVAPKIGAAIALTRLLQLFPAQTVAWRPVLAALAVATMTTGQPRRIVADRRTPAAGLVLGIAIRLRPDGRNGGRAHRDGPVGTAVLSRRLRRRQPGRLRRRHAAAWTYRSRSLPRTGGRAAWNCGGIGVSFLSLVGIPPLAGFIGKLMLFLATIDAGYAWLAVVAVINTVISLFYYLRVLGPMYFDAAPAPVAILGRWAGCGLFIAGISVLLLGLGAEVVLAAFRRATLLP